MSKSLKDIGLIVAAALVLAFTAQFAIRTYISQPFMEAASDLPKIERNAREIGLPLTYDELYKNHPISSSDNACLEYKQAIEELTKVNKAGSSSYLYWSSTFTYGTEEDRQWVLQQSKRRQGIIEALLKASEKPSFASRGIWDKPNFLKEGVNLLIGQAWLDSHQGNLKKALIEIKASYRIAAHIGQEPGFVQLFSQVVACETIDEKVQEMLPAFSKDQSSLKILRNLAANNHPTLNIGWAWKSDFVTSLINLQETASRPMSWNQMIDEIEEMEPGMLSKRRISGLVPKDLVTKSFRARLIECYTFAEAERLRNGHFDGTLEALHKKIDEGVKSDDLTYTFMPMFDLEQLPLDDVLHTGGAYKDLLIAMIDIVLFKQRTGHFPKSLTEADIQALDPFTSGPLQYRIQDNRAILYSVGTDLHDDGGSGPYRPDIVYSYPPVIPNRMETTNAPSVEKARKHR